MKPRLHWLAAAACLFIAGCYQRATEGNDAVFSFQAWVPLCVVLVGLAAVPAGLVMFARNQKVWGVIVALGGPILAGVIAPGMFLDRVIVNEDGFYSRHGFWWSPSIHKIRYDDLSEVILVVEESTGRRGRKSYSYYFDCNFKSGSQERVPLGDIMREALPEISQQIRNHNVPLRIPADLPG